jgi:hypothetical protein
MFCLLTKKPTKLLAIPFDGTLARLHNGRNRVLNIYRRVYVCVLCFNIPPLLRIVCVFAGAWLACVTWSSSVRFAFKQGKKNSNNKHTHNQYSPSSLTMLYHQQQQQQQHQHNHHHHQSSTSSSEGRVKKKEKKSSWRNPRWANSM